jgi:hypothetical protein
VARIFVQEYRDIVTVSEGLMHVAEFVVYVFHDHSITTDPCCTLRVLSTSNNTLSLTIAEKYSTRFDGDEYGEN